MRQSPSLNMCMVRAAGTIITGTITMGMTIMDTTIMTMSPAAMTIPMKAMDMRATDTRVTDITATTTGDTDIRMTDGAGAGVGSSLPLLIWLSPAFPVGAFAYSHGLESAVEHGDITDAATLQAWLDDLVRFGSMRTDAVLAACAWRAARAQDDAALDEVNDLTLALAPSQERHLETTAQGGAFVKAAQASWPCEAIERLAQRAQTIAYPVAVSVAAAGHDVPLPALLEAYLVAFAGNLVSAAVRLGPVGQTDGQRIIARLAPALCEVAQMAAAATLDDLGAFAMRSDIAAMRHETQYSRLFRS